MAEKSICKYCGTAYKVIGRNKEIYPSCREKLPLVQKFVEVCDDIKKKVYKENK